MFCSNCINDIVHLFAVLQELAQATILNLWFGQILTIKASMFKLATEEYFENDRLLIKAQFLSIGLTESVYFFGKPCSHLTYDKESCKSQGCKVIFVKNVLAFKSCVIMKKEICLKAILGKGTCAKLQASDVCK